MYLILCIVLVIKLIWGAYVVQADYMSILLKDLAVIRSFIHESFANFSIYDIRFNYSYLIESMKLS